MFISDYSLDLYALEERIQLTAMRKNRQFLFEDISINEAAEAEKLVSISAIKNFTQC
jgi:hypothetical protein